MKVAPRYTLFTLLTWFTLLTLLTMFLLLGRMGHTPKTVTTVTNKAVVAHYALGSLHHLTFYICFSLTCELTDTKEEMWLPKMLIMVMFL